MVLSYRKGAFMRAISAVLGQWSYRITVKCLSQLETGLPARRRRTNALGVHADTRSSAAVWPRGIPPMGLKELLGPRTSDDDPNRRPGAKVACVAASFAADREKEMGIANENDWMVNVHHSEKWARRGARPS